MPHRPDDDRSSLAPPTALASSLLGLSDLPPEERSLALRTLRARWPEHTEFLDCYEAALSQVAADDGLAAYELPDSIGPYRILERIGAGGMGVVYRAERTEPIRLTVAIKVIREGVASEVTARRFEYERRALAAMDHPAIARILDAGTTSRGQPYYVMEYVEGEPITGHCDRHRLSVPQRLRLFQRVCEGVQHAHQKGVIHRDIKPLNILVTQHGREHLPKVLDFGLAKPTVPDLTNPLLSAPDCGVGTPGYMAPEQAVGAASAPDARADVYSLGVVLYELLTGTVPYSATMLRVAGPLESRRILQEVAPLLPSRRFATDDGEGTQAAVDRAGTTRTVTRALRGDLDWIVLRALAKDPAQRYPSAAALAADIQRHLDHQPVAAAPPGALYRLRKLLRRRRGPMAAAGLVLLTAFGGALAAICYALQAAEQGAAAAFQARRAYAGEQLALARAAEIERQNEEIARRGEQLATALAEETKARRLAQLREYSSSLTAAEAALNVGDAITARQRLERAPAELRGFEWQHLASRLDGSRTRLSGHSSTPRAIAVDPHGRWFASSAQDHCVILWDAQTLEPIHRWPGQPTCPVVLVPHPTGERLFVSRELHSVVCIGVETREVLWECPLTDAAGVGDLACDTSGERLFAGCRNGDVVMLDAATGAVRATFAGSGSQCSAVAVSRDGRSLAVGRMDGGVELRSAADGSLVRALPRRDDIVIGVAFCCDDRHIVAAAGRTMSTWNREEEGPPRELHPHGHNIASLAASADGRQFATTAYDGTVRIFDAESADLRRILVGHTSLQVTTAVFWAGDHGVLSGAADNTIRVWDLDDAPVATLAGAAGWFPGIAIAADGSIAESGGTHWNYPRGEAAVARWCVDSARSWRRPVDPSTGIDRLVFDHTDQRLLAGTMSGRVVALDASDGAQLGVIQAHTAPINGLALIPHGHSFATTGREGVIKVWTMDPTVPWRCRLSSTIDVGEMTSTVATSPDGRLLAVGLRGAAAVYELASGRRLATLRGHADWVHEIVFDPAGHRLATACFDSTAKLWRVEDGSELATLRHADRVYAVAFSPDGTRLATGSIDTTVRLWDAASGQQLLALHGHHNRVYALRFSPDGSRLYSKDILGEILAWDTEPDARRRNEPQSMRRLAAQVRRAREQATSAATEPADLAALRAWREDVWLPVERARSWLQQQVRDLARVADATTADTPPDDPVVAAASARGDAAAGIAAAAQGGPAGEATLEARFLEMTASQLNDIAWARVAPALLAQPDDESAMALACARLALRRIEQEQDTSVPYHCVLDTLAWALLATGQQQAALDAAMAAVAASPPGEQGAAAQSLLRLEAELAARRQPDLRAAEAVPRLAAAVDRDRYAAAADLARDIDAVAHEITSVVDGALQRHELAAKAMPDDHARRWQEAAAAIATADDQVASADYATEYSVRLEPIDGLVPIGMNPATRLWEFYDLTTAADPTALPTHDAMGGITVTSDTGIILVLVPGGTFTMGARAGDRVRGDAGAGTQPDEAADRVQLAPFLIGRHEVTQAQWQRLAGGDRPSVFQPGLRYAGDITATTLTCPVENVPFVRAIEVLHWNGLDLPTEAQWEYACRAGAHGAWPTHLAQSAAAAFANIFDLDALPRMPGRVLDAFAVHDGRATTAPVGSFAANAFGLHDMHGNVAELCRDWRLSYSIPAAGPAGLRGDAEADGSERVIRGGSWMSPLGSCRPSARSSQAPDRSTPWVGIRVVRPLR